MRSNTSRRAAGTAKQLQGIFQKTVGRLFGSERLEAEGRARELAGRDEKEAAKAMERAKGAVENVAGRVQSAAGDLIDDPEMSASGQLRKAKGKLRETANQ
jgi:uncharacterized protein YjbJ (UPF0337 family)